MNTALIPIVGPEKITKRGGELVIKLIFQKFKQIPHYLVIMDLKPYLKQ